MQVEEDLVLEVQSAWRENVHTRRWGGCAAVLLLTALLGLRFVPHAWRVGQQLSEPQLLFRGVNLSAGGEIVQACAHDYAPPTHCALSTHSGCACCGRSSVLSRLHEHPLVAAPAMAALTTAQVGSLIQACC